MCMFSGGNIFHLCLKQEHTLQNCGESNNRLDPAPFSSSTAPREIKSRQSKARQGCFAIAITTGVRVFKLLGIRDEVSPLNEKWGNRKRQNPIPPTRPGPSLAAQGRGTAPRMRAHRRTRSARTLVAPAASLFPFPHRPGRAPTLPRRTPRGQEWGWGRVRGSSVRAALPSTWEPAPGQAGRDARSLQRGAERSGAARPGGAPRCRPGGGRRGAATAAVRGCDVLRA